MNNEQPKRKTRQTKLVEKVLQREYPSTEAYRYNPASIRVRIIDERFRGLSRIERDDLVSPLLSELPEEIQVDITILLLLTPEEIKTSAMNVEFEHPSPSLV
jgi:stress-induced morphogen